MSPRPALSQDPPRGSGILADLTALAVANDWRSTWVNRIARCEANCRRWDDAVAYIHRVRILAIPMLPIR